MDLFTEVFIALVKLEDLILLYDVRLCYAVLLFISQHDW